MATFNVGDTVCWNNEYFATVSRIKEDGHGQKLYGDWKGPTGFIGDKNFFLYVDSQMRLIQPPMMEYNPDQQGEDDDSI